jgi:hypothetical protein
MITEKKFREMLLEVMQKDYVDIWLTTSNEQFGNLTPIEILKQGNDQIINEMIYRLRSGIPI